MLLLARKFFYECRKRGVYSALYKFKCYIGKILFTQKKKIRPSNGFENHRQQIYDFINFGPNLQREVILLFSHDLSRSGAPILVLNLAKFLSQKMNYAVIVICLKDGELLDEFNKYSYVINLEQKEIYKIDSNYELKEIFGFLKDISVHKAILNTLGGALLIPYLDKYGIKYIILIHELPDVINRIGWANIIGSLPQQFNNNVIFSSDYAFNTFIKEYKLDIEKHIYPQGCVLDDIELDVDAHRAALRISLAIDHNAKIVLGAGKDFYRKGVDIFYEIANETHKSNPELYFVWCGDINELAVKELSKANQNSHIKFINFVDNCLSLFSSVDLFILTSREDPFPNVVLDSLFCGIPVLSYKDCGGSPELLQKIDDLLLVDKFDNEMFVERIIYMLNHENQQKYDAISARAKIVVRQEYNFSKYVDNIMGTFSFNPKVSVIIPNYNYEKYLPKRINSILEQTIKPYEIIFLDDCSVDNSVKVAEDLLKNSEIPYKIVVNKENLGVFKQWTNGIQLATYDYVWIAEADDYCNKDFLYELTQQLESDQNIVIAYCQSNIVDEFDGVVQDNILSHTNELSDTKWLYDSNDSGRDIVEQYFIHRNLIVNVSGCVFRRSACVDIDFVKLESFKYCGDWYFYTALLCNGRLSYSHKIMNSYRRHNKNVTLQNNSIIAYLDELVEIKKFIIDNYNINDVVLRRAINFINSDFNFDKKIVQDKFNQLISAVKSKKILFVSTNPSAMVGGGSEVLWQEAALNLAKKGYKVAIYLEYRHLLKSRVNLFLDNGIIVYYGEEHGHRCLITFKPELVIFSQGDHNEGTSWYQSCKKTNIEYVIINQLVKEGFWPDDLSASDVHNFYRNAKTVFFTCKQNKLLMERQLGINLINSNYHFNPVTIDRSVKLHYPVPVDNYHLACPGRYTVLHKGQDILFEVLNDEKWKRRNLVINLYGHGNNQLQLENLKKHYNLKNILLNKYQADILEIWKNNHGIIMPSRFEGVPIVLLGAMLCRRVPIVTDVGGHGEIIKHGFSGFIAKAATVDLIDEALENAWQNRENWEEIGKNAREEILEFMPTDPVTDFINKIIN